MQFWILICYPTLFFICTNVKISYAYAILFLKRYYFCGSTLPKPFSTIHSFIQRYVSYLVSMCKTVTGVAQTGSDVV